MHPKTTEALVRDLAEWKRRAEPQLDRLTELEARIDTLEGRDATPAKPAKAPAKAG